METRIAFTIAQISAWLGPLTSASCDKPFYAWYHENAKAHYDGCVPPAVCYEVRDDGTHVLCIHVDLPEQLYFALYGYAKMHDMETEELMTFTEAPEWDGREIPGTSHAAGYHD